jgi:hypothetical protein
MVEDSGSPGYEYAWRTAEGKPTVQPLPFIILAVVRCLGKSSDADREEGLVGRVRTSPLHRKSESRNRRIIERGPEGATPSALDCRSSAVERANRNMPAPLKDGCSCPPTRKEHRRAQHGCRRLSDRYARSFRQFVAPGNASTNRQRFAT